MKSDSPSPASSPPLCDAVHAVPCWLFQTADENGRTRWQTLRRCDQQKLDDGLAKLQESGSRSQDQGAEQPSSDDGGGDGDDGTAVLVEGGRAEVRLRRRALSDRYGPDPLRANLPVRRALWFHATSDPKVKEPYDEADDAAIETAFQSLLEQVKDLPGELGAEPSRQVALTFGNRAATLTLKRNVAPDAAARWKLIAEEAPVQESSWLLSAQNALIGKVLQVSRGYGDLPLQHGEAEEELLTDEVRNVIILVHGIGEKLWAEDNCGLSGNAAQFRSNMHKSQLRAAGYVRKGNAWQSPSETPRVLPKDEVLEAHWWQDLHTEELDSRLARSTLPSVPAMRKFFNFALIDGLCYFQAKRRLVVATAVADAVHRALARFRKHHPEFKGGIALAGHSLGGAVLFELLRGRGCGSGAEGAAAGEGSDCADGGAIGGSAGGSGGGDVGAGVAVAGTGTRLLAPPEVLPCETGSSLATGFPHLLFTPAALFTFGSPTALVIHVADTVPERSFSLPGGVRYFNIFHPLDPVAYRMEPLFAEEFAEHPPEPVPAEGAWGGVKMHHNLERFRRWATGQERKTQQAVQNINLALNRGERVDWVLQEDLTFLGVAAGAAGEMLQAARSHSCYWASPDVAAFLMNRTAELLGNAAEAPESSAAAMKASASSERGTSPEPPEPKPAWPWR